MTKSLLYHPLWLGMLVALACGCTSDRIPTYPVKGRVQFPNGEPVRTGVIEFQSREHPLNARSKIARDGSFSLGTYEDSDGAVAGAHRAIVVQFLAADSGPDIEHDHGEAVHPKHADYQTSGLKFDVSSAENVLTVEVEMAP